LLLITMIVATVFAFLPRIPQPQSYHSFADHRSLFSIANFGDVVSNLPFAVILQEMTESEIDAARSPGDRTMAARA
jgi:hypothetical protein